MMDKQKQIEEMAKDLYGIQTYSYMEIYPCRQEQSNEIVAEHLVEKGWIKPAKNAVVLETSVYESLDIKLYRDIITEKVRKETAEKFAERLKGLFPINEDVFRFSTPEQIQKAVDEICKEIAEG